MKNVYREKSMEDVLDTVILGDCLSVLPEIPSESVDLTVFSPPYDGIRDYKGEWKFNFTELGHEIYRVSKEGAMACVVIGDGTKNFAKSLTSFRLAVDWCDHSKWRLFECCIYRRDGNPGAWWNSRFRVDHEYILMFLKGSRPKHFVKDHLMVPSKHAGKIYSGTDRLTNGGFKTIAPKPVNPMKCRGTVWTYATSNTEGNKIKLKHPATFPDLLAEDLIRCFSAPGQIVLDPMCGSGTTCIVANKYNRHFIGIDISSEYCEIAKKRIDYECANIQQMLCEGSEPYVPKTRHP